MFNLSVVLGLDLDLTVTGLVPSGLVNVTGYCPRTDGQAELVDIATDFTQNTAITHS